MVKLLDIKGFALIIIFGYNRPEYFKQQLELYLKISMQ